MLIKTKTYLASLLLAYLLNLISRLENKKTKLTNFKKTFDNFCYFKYYYRAENELSKVK